MKIAQTTAYVTIRPDLPKDLVFGFFNMFPSVEFSRFGGSITIDGPNAEVKAVVKEMGDDALDVEYLEQDVSCHEEREEPCLELYSETGYDYGRVD